MDSKTNSTLKKDAIIAGAGILLILVFMFVTDPQVLTAPFLLLLPTFVLCSSYYIFKILLELMADFDTVKLKGLSIVLSLGPTLLIIFSSLGNIGFQDIALSLLLVSGSAWYLKRFLASGNSLT